MTGIPSFSGGRDDDTSKFDDDGRPKRTGTLFTASAHIVTAVIGSGVLSLAWATAQLGWIAGPVSLITFSVITWFTSTLLADCYRSPDPVTGIRNYTYSAVVKSNLGGVQYRFLGLAQYANLFGVTIGYTLTTAISMVAIKKSNCFHKHGHQADCSTSNNPYMLVYGAIQILLSQLPNFHELSFLSIIAAVMSFGYSSIGFGLAVAKVIGGVHVQTDLTGTQIGKNLTSMDKMWNTFAALGDIAFAYSFSMVLIEIQDTLKSSPPENKVMKKAAFTGISITTTFYLLCGLVGYAAFGNDAPGNFLTGFGFYEPYWLVDFANVCIIIHLVGAYQVFCQPLFAVVERWSSKKWSNSSFVNGETIIPLPKGGKFPFSLFRLVWRTGYVILTTLMAMAFPFFNNFVGLIGAISFWPLTVYFPVEMYIAQAKIPKYSVVWLSMKLLSFVCLVITLLAAAGSIQGLIESLKTVRLFHSMS